MAFPLILGVVAFTVIQASGKSEAGPMSLPRETFLDEQKQAFLAWTFNDTHIDVSITVKTRGWLAFGLSPNGEMHQTDAFVAWVNDTDGVPFLQDGWLESNATARRVTLVRDSQQDWTLLQGIQTTDETMIRAVRALVTCDRHRDRPFSRDTLRILWAAHDKDPVDPARLPHHKKRGVKSMLMFSPSYLRTTPVPDTTTADTHPEEVVMQFEQVLIPNDTITLSQCRLFQLPKIEKKRHIIKTRAMVQAGNEQYVQRMLASLCRGKFEQNLSPATFDCHAPGNAQMMLAVRQNCDALIAAWAVGGEVFSYPEETGLPLDVDSSGRYVLLEVQYGNLPKDVFLSEAIRDSSGIVLTTSDTLRRHDAAFLTTGLLQFDYPLTIPPNTPSFTLQSHCMDFCTQSSFPSTGINVFAALPITHIQGRNITLRHIRNGKELTQLIKDDNPDARYQETRFLPSTTVVFPGDRLILECQYSTLGKSTVTFGGYAAEDETCLAYLSYYPAVNTTSCGSMIDTRAFLELTEYIPTTSSASPSLSSDAVLSQEVANSSVLRAFYTNKYDFNADNTKKLLKFYDEHDQLGVCLGNGADSMKAIHSAPYVPLPVKASTCVGKPSVQIPPPITISTAIGSADAMSGNKNASAKDTLIVKPVTVPRMTSLKPNDLTSMAAAAVQRNAGMRRSAVCFAALSVVVAVITTAFNA